MISSAGPIAWVEGFGAVAPSLPAVWTGRLDRANPRDRPSPTASDLGEAAERPEAAKAAFLARRGQLRCVLARQLGLAPEAVEIAADHDGAPRVLQPGAALFVSSASRDGWVALALAPARIGVDLEVVTDPVEPAWNVLSRTEQGWLGSLPAPDRWPAFLALWTGKEAYLKAIGTGLRREPANITIGIGPNGGLSVLDQGHAAALTGAEHRRIVAGDTVLSVACAVLRP